MKSLKFKLILALIFTGLATIALVAITANWLVNKRFNEIAMDSAFSHFHEDVTNYISQYGSWQDAAKFEPFIAYVHRTRGIESRSLPSPRGGFSPPPRPLKNRPFPPPKGLSSGGGGSFPPPPPSFEGAAEFERARGFERNPGDAGAGPGPGPGRAPFRFMLVDPSGVVMLGAGGYEQGDKISASVKEETRPVTVNGEIVAYAHPIGLPNLGQDDLDRLGVIKEALSYGLLAAVILALFLGLFLGHRLVISIKELTHAIRAMNRGDLYQKVSVKSQDEVGELADSFNKMSEDLHHAYQKLESSNRTISSQAAQLKELSIRDELTQLYNRRYFNEHAARIYSESTRYGHPLTLVIGDLDHFKQINDRFSHAVGDKVLRRVGQLLKETTRDSDVVARYGGEEFVIAYTETALEKAVQLCERIRRSMGDVDWTEFGEGLEVRCSMGICSNTTLGSYEQMLAFADQKLYEAKEQGRNRVCY